MTEVWYRSGPDVSIATATPRGASVIVTALNCATGSAARVTPIPANETAETANSPDTQSLLIGRLPLSWDLIPGEPERQARLTRAGILDERERDRVRRHVGHVTVPTHLGHHQILAKPNLRSDQTQQYVTITYSVVLCVSSVAISLSPVMMLTCLS